MHWTSDQRAALAEQRKVHAPGIDSHGCKSAILSGNSDCIPNFLNKPGRVPVKRVPDFDRAIGKSVDNIEGQLSVIRQRPDHAAAALRSEVNRKYSCHPISSTPNHLHVHYPPLWMQGAKVR